VPECLGYQPLSFFARTRATARGGSAGALSMSSAICEGCASRGIEVILDVVYNHMREGGADGATLSFRGLANETYYILDENDQGHTPIHWHGQYSQRQRNRRASPDSGQPAPW